MNHHRDPISPRSALLTGVILLLALASLTLASLDNPPAPPFPALPDGAILRLGKGRFQAMALSPDGGTLAVACAIGVYLHDSATLDVNTFIPTTSPVLSIAYAPSQRGANRFAVGLQDGSVVIYWRPGESRAWHPARLGSHSHPVTSVVWSPDGRLLASASTVGHIKVWEASTGRVVYDLTDWGDGLPGNPLSSGGSERTVLAFNVDGTLLAAGHAYGHVAVWETASGALLWHIKEQNSPVHTITWLSDSTLALRGFRDVEMWDVRAGEHMDDLEVGSSHDFALSPSGDRLAILGWSGVTIRDLTGQAQDIEIPGDTRFQFTVRWTPDERRLITADPLGGALVVWDIASRNIVRKPADYLGDIDGVTWSPGGDEILYGSGYTIYRWNVESNTLTTIEHANGGGSAAPRLFLPDGRTLITLEGTADRGVVYFRDAPTGEVLAQVVANRYWVALHAASPDGSMIATAGSADPAVYVFDTQTYTLLYTLVGPTWGAVSLAWSPDGMRLATLWSDERRFNGISGNELIVWEAATQKPVVDIVVPDVSMRGLFWRSGDAPLAVAVDGDTLALWDFERNERRSPLSNQWTSPIQEVAWSADGARLAIASDDLRIRVWDVETARLLHTFAGHTDRISALAWSPDQRFLASSAWDGTVLVWEIAP